MYTSWSERLHKDDVLHPETHLCRSGKRRGDSSTGFKQIYDNYNLS